MRPGLEPAVSARFAVTVCGMTEGVAGVPEYGLQITSAGTVLLTNPTDATDIVRLRLLAGLLREHGPIRAKEAMALAIQLWAGTQGARLTWRPANGLQP